MRNKLRTGLLFISFTFFPMHVYAHEEDTVKGELTTTDTSLIKVADPPEQSSAESLRPASNLNDTLSSGTTAPVPSPEVSPQKLELIKRTYNSRQQVFLAAGMMIFVVGIMTLAQQWNPQ